jgi:hypothetical protein
MTIPVGYGEWVLVIEEIATCCGADMGASGAAHEIRSSEAQKRLAANLTLARDPHHRATRRQLSASHIIPDRRAARDGQD